MRQVYEQPEEANKKAKRAAVDIRLIYSPAAVAEVIKARLDVIQSFLSIVAGGNMVQQETLKLPTRPVSTPPRLPLEIITKSKWATASRFGKLGRLAKKVMVRLLHFYAIHQDNMNRYLLTSNQFIWERAQQQQVFVNELKRQMAFLENHIEALQAETQQVAEVLQHNINLQLLISNQPVREQAQQQVLVDELERQVASLRKRVEALQTETQNGSK
jgi:uncharacterized small protein (DUF1192 family)